MNGDLYDVLTNYNLSVANFFQFACSSFRDSYPQLEFPRYYDTPSFGSDMQDDYAVISRQKLYPITGKKYVITGVREKRDGYLFYVFSVGQQKFAVKDCLLDTNLPPGRYELMDDGTIYSIDRTLTGMYVLDGQAHEVRTDHFIDPGVFRGNSRMEGVIVMVDGVQYKWKRFWTLDIRVESIREDFVHLTHGFRVHTKYCNGVSLGQIVEYDIKTRSLVRVRHDKSHPQNIGDLLHADGVDVFFDDLKSIAKIKAEDIELRVKEKLGVGAIGDVREYDVGSADYINGVLGYNLGVVSVDVRKARCKPVYFVHGSLVSRPRTPMRFGNDRMFVEQLSDILGVKFEFIVTDNYYIAKVPYDGHMMVVEFNKQIISEICALLDIKVSEFNPSIAYSTVCYPINKYAHLDVIKNDVDRKLEFFREWFGHSIVLPVRQTLEIYFASLSPHSDHDLTIYNHYNSRRIFVPHQQGYIVMGRPVKLDIRGDTAQREKIDLFGVYAGIPPELPDADKKFLEWKLFGKSLSDAINDHKDRPEKWACKQYIEHKVVGAHHMPVLIIGPGRMTFGHFVNCKIVVVEPDDNISFPSTITRYKDISEVKENNFGMILMEHSLHHVKLQQGIQIFLRKLYGKLLPGGRLMLKEHDVRTIETFSRIFYIHRAYQSIEHGFMIDPGKVDIYQLFNFERLIVEFMAVGFKLGDVEHIPSYMATVVANFIRI